MTEQESILSTLLDERNQAVRDQIKKEPNLRLSLQQMTETFILVKLAEYELRLQKLEAKNN